MGCLSDRADRRPIAAQQFFSSVRSFLSSCFTRSPAHLSFPLLATLFLSPWRPNRALLHPTQPSASKVDPLPALAPFSSHSSNPSAFPGENHYRDAKKLKRLNMLKDKGTGQRDNAGNLVRPAPYQSSDVTPGMVQPDRRWFGERPSSFVFAKLDQGD